MFEGIGDTLIVFFHRSVSHNIRGSGRITVAPCSFIDFNRFYLMAIRAFKFYHTLIIAHLENGLFPVKAKFIKSYA